MRAPKIDLLYIITLLFLFLTANNSNFLSANNLYWFVILLFMLVVAIAKKLMARSDLKIILVFSAVYLGFVAIRDLFINGLGMDFLTSDAIFLFKYVLLSFTFCVILKDRLTDYLVKVLIHLTIISFFFYFFQLIGLGNTLYSYFTSINLPNGINSPGYSNILIFTYDTNHEFRNSGFFWEPGAFVCILIVGLLLHLFTNKFSFDRRTKLLLVGIVTTVSTTGYLALLILFFLWYRYKVPRLNIWVVVLIPVSIILILNIPVLGDKISKTFDDDMSMSHSEIKRSERYLKARQDRQVALNRFSSAVVIYEAFGSELILGVSNKYDEILNNIENVNISNGIMAFLAKFGLVGFIFVIYKYSKFCIIYVGKVELLIYCILILIVLSIGESIMFLPFILNFLFMTLQQLPPEKNVRGRISPAR